MRQFTTSATLIMSLPDGMTDAQAFYILNQNCNPYGVDFVFPLISAVDRPAIVIRILKNENPINPQQVA